MDDPAECVKRIRAALDKMESSGFDTSNEQNQQIAGDMLLDFCNLNRILKLDGEKALTYSTNRFIINFSLAEKKAQQSGKKLDEMSEDELRDIMNEVLNG